MSSFFDMAIEFRKDPLLNNWVVVGFKKTKTNAVGTCPFCPGNEEKTPPVIREFRDQNGAWQVRCFPAGNPVLQIEANENKRAEGLYDKMGTLGADELIVENPSHTKTFSTFTESEMSLTVDMYIDRIVDLKKDERFKYIQIFKNHGELTGSYIFHPHSHVLAMPILPHQLAIEIGNSRNHYLQKERCLLCDIVSQEVRQDKRVVTATDHFLVIAPFASRVSFEVWIVPRHHSHSFEAGLPRGVKEDFVKVLLDTMKRIEKIASSYSVVLHTSPKLPYQGSADNEPSLEDYFHWHVEILPRDFNSSKFKRDDEFYATLMTPEEATAILKAESP
jgi:UDPglucose--hexose-1-phosphate uridylyltransferase